IAVAVRAPGRSRPRLAAPAGAAPAGAQDEGATTTTAAPAPAKVWVSPAPQIPVAVAGLTARLDATLANTASCLEVRDTGGAFLSSRNGASPLAPASTQKLLVAAA